MGTTRSKAAKAEELRVSQIGDFKKRLGGLTQLPSGAVVKLFNPGGLQAFLNGGVIPNSLMGIVQKGLSSGKTPTPEEFLKDKEIDAELLEELMGMMDAVVVKVVVEPPVLAVPSDPADRDEELLYVDEFPLEDKQFIFQWVSGGTRDLETFRSKLNSNVELVAAVTDAGSDTQ